jgi:ribosomal protein L37AE/L43A
MTKRFPRCNLLVFLFFQTDAECQEWKGRMAPGFLVNKRKTKLQCPKCKERQMARIARRGFLRVRIFPLVGLFPWQCAMCGTERLRFKRSGLTPGPRLAGQRGDREVAEASREDLAS